MSTASSSSASAENEFDCFRDLEVDGTLSEESDIGLRFDLRLLTRYSAPPMWSERTRQRVPDCAALVSMANAAIKSNDLHTYESCMRKLVCFFGNSVPVRTPQEVRCGFQLGAPSADDIANEQCVVQKLRFLDATETNAICNEPMDVSEIDALEQAELEQRKEQ